MYCVFSNIIIGGFMLLYFNCNSEILAVDTGYTSPLIIVLEYYNKEEIGLIRKIKVTMEM